MVEFISDAAISNSCKQIKNLWISSEIMLDNVIKVTISLFLSMGTGVFRID